MPKKKRTTEQQERACELALKPVPADGLVSVLKHFLDNLSGLTQAEQESLLREAAKQLDWGVKKSKKTKKKGKK